MKGSISFFLVFSMLLLAGLDIQAQFPGAGRLGNMMKSSGAGGGGRRAGGGGGGKSDSLQFEKRNWADDSVAIRFRYLDTARFYPIDTSIIDYFDKIPMKAEYINLGNNGTATRSLLFSPMMKAGWDPGHHAFDIYAFSIDDTRFLNTNKPFTRLTYLLGSKSEQHIGVHHTQNINPDWNVSLEYRLINAPGFYNSQNTNHNNIRFNTNFGSKNKRYNAFFVFIRNALQSSENGGIVSDSFLVNSNPAYNDRFNIPTNLAQSPFSSRNFFNVKLTTGNRFVNNTLLLRQQYDLGKKDSLVTDSSVIRFFLPRLRFEHTFRYTSYNFLFTDNQATAEQPFYIDNYNLSGLTGEVEFQDQWKELYNDFSIIQFPEAKNPLQFLKLGASLQNLSGSFSNALTDRFSNVRLHGEYRNRTRNKKWDMLLYGEFYGVGRNAGDYLIQAKLKTFLGNKWGDVELGFRNVNRKPSYPFTRLTSFPVNYNNSLNAENNIHFFGVIDQPRYHLQFHGDYFVMTNYVYLTDYKNVLQNSGLFSMLRLGMSKQSTLKKRWKWYLDVYLQSKIGNGPINVPLVYARNRFAYEGSVFRNLKLSTGLDLRYHTPYKADGYSPLLGMFFFQDATQLAIRPDFAAYVNFRIRNFTGFTRLENLNTLTTQYGFGFKKSNFAVDQYPYPGMLLRIGVVWDMVN